MEEIEIDSSLEDRDLWRYYLREYFSFSAGFYFFLSFTIFGSCVVFFSLGNLGFQNLVQVCIFAILFICLFNFVMSYFSVENAKRINIRNCKYIFSDKKVEMITKLFKSQIDWNYFSTVKETTHYFILQLKDGHKNFIPKRYFKNSEQVSNFKNLLYRKFGEEIQLKKSKENLGLK